MWCLKSCYLQGKYEAIDAVGANVASGGDGGGRRYSCNMIRLRIIKPDEQSCYKKKGIALYSTTKPGGAYNFIEIHTTSIVYTIYL